MICEPIRLSVVIPALNEAETLGRTLEGLRDHVAEIIVVDGGSEDGTVEVARPYTPHVLTTRSGRGFQLHTGARRSRGDILLFLHADTLLPTDFDRLIRRALSDQKTVFGAFFLKIRPSTATLCLIAFMANLRSRLLKLPYGDQAIFVRRSAYFQAGGFQDWPIMEDVGLVRRLNRIGGFKLVRASVETSARRWQNEKVWYTTLRNWSLMCRYALGISPHVLSRHYPDTR